MVNEDIKSSFREKEESFTKIYLFWQLFTTMALMMPLVITILIFMVTICMIIAVAVSIIVLIVVYIGFLATFITLYKVASLILYPRRLAVFKLFKYAFP